MIVKGTKQLGNFKRGINIYVPKRIVAPPAPSGIPVASTTNLLITFNNQSFNTTFNFVNQLYTKFAYPTAHYTTVNSYEGPNLIFDFYYVPGVWSFLQADGEGGYDLHAQNRSTNGDYIPTTGWIGGFTTLTIAAA